MDKKEPNEILDTRERFIMSALDRHSKEIEELRLLLSDVKEQLAELREEVQGWK